MTKPTLQEQIEALSQIANYGYNYSTDLQLGEHIKAVIESLKKLEHIESKFKPDSVKLDYIFLTASEIDLYERT